MEAQPDNMEFLVVDHSKEEGFEAKDTWGKVPVRFIGRVSQEKMVDLYRQIDVLFAPSTWPESFGLVTREAAACGCWVVASKLGGLSEDVVNNVNGNVIDSSLHDIDNVLKAISKKGPTFYKEHCCSPSLLNSRDQAKDLIRSYND